MPPDGVRGVFATSPIARHEVLLTVPWRALLSAVTVHTSGDGVLAAAEQEAATYRRSADSLQTQLDQSLQKQLTLQEKVEQSASSKPNGSPSKDKPSSLQPLEDDDELAKELADEIELRTFTDVERLMEPPDGIEPGTFDHFCDRCCCYRILALCCILILPTAVVIVYLHLKLA